MPETYGDRVKVVQRDDIGSHWHYGQLRGDWRRNDPEHWHSATFLVPASVDPERVERDLFTKKRNQFGELLERKGYRVKSIDGPKVWTGLVSELTTDPDMRPYIMWAETYDRQPIVTKWSVPDEDVPIYEKAGFKLID